MSTRRGTIAQHFDALDGKLGNGVQIDERPSQEAAALGGLPIVALRLEPSALAAAARFGLDRVGDLYPMPRGPLAKSLGLATVNRLDQSLGRAAEPIVPVSRMKLGRYQLGTPFTLNSDYEQATFFGKRVRQPECRLLGHRSQELPVG